MQTSGHLKLNAPYIDETSDTEEHPYRNLPISCLILLPLGVSVTEALHSMSQPEWASTKPLTSVYAEVIPDLSLISPDMRTAR